MGPYISNSPYQLRSYGKRPSTYNYPAVAKKRLIMLPQRSGITNSVSSLVVHRGTARRKSNTFRNKFLKNEAAKHLANVTFQNAMTMDTIYSFNVTALVTQGTGNANRIGDHIDIEALKIRGSYATDPVANFYTFRIIVGWTGEEYTGTSYAVQLTSTELFLPNTFGAGSNLAIINPKAFTVLHDEVIDVNSNIVTTSDGSTFGFTVPISQKFNYQSTASVLGKTRNLMVAVMASAKGGTVGVTAAGSHLVAFDLIFK